MTKKIITIFFLSVFLIQLLPLREVGKLVAGATMTEELPETGASKSAVDAKWFLTSVSYNNSNELNTTSQFQYIHFSETLPFRLPGDVQTPPPDIFC